MKTKVIIEQNRSAIEEALYPFERKAWLLNLFMDKMEQVGYPIKTISQIEAVLTSGAEKYIRLSIVNKAQFEIAGIKLNKAALIDVVELPNITEVLSVERLLKEYHNVSINKLSFENGRFSILESMKDQYIQMHTRYAESARHVEMFEEAKKLVSAVNRFHKKFGPESIHDRGHHPFAQIENILHWNVKSWEYEVNTQTLINHPPKGRTDIESVVKGLNK